MNIDEDIFFDREIEKKVLDIRKRCAIISPTRKKEKDMIVVKDVEVMHVPDGRDAVIARLKQPDYHSLNDSESISVNEIHVESEYVHGFRFRNANGEEIYLGMSEKVQEALGLPLEALEKVWPTKVQMELLQNQLDSSKEYCKLLQNREKDNEMKIMGYEKNMIRIYNFSLWERFKFFLFGKKFLKENV